MMEVTVDHATETGLRKIITQRQKALHEKGSAKRMKAEDEELETLRQILPFVDEDTMVSEEQAETILQWMQEYCQNLARYSHTCDKVGAQLSFRMELVAMIRQL